MLAFDVYLSLKLERATKDGTTNETLFKFKLNTTTKLYLFRSENRNTNDLTSQSMSTTK